MFLNFLLRPVYICPYSRHSVKMCQVYSNQTCRVAGRRVSTNERDGKRTVFTGSVFQIIRTKHPQLRQPKQGSQVEHKVLHSSLLNHSNLWKSKVLSPTHHSTSAYFDGPHIVLWTQISCKFAGCFRGTQRTQAGRADGRGRELHQGEPDQTG